MFRIAGCALLGCLFIGMASAQTQNSARPLKNFVADLKECGGTQVKVSVLDFVPRDRMRLVQQERDDVRNAMSEALSGIKIVDPSAALETWIREEKQEHLLPGILGSVDVAIVFRYVRHIESSTTILWTAQAFGRCSLSSTPQPMPARTGTDPVPIENRFNNAADRLY